MTVPESEHPMKDRQPPSDGPTQPRTTPGDFIEGQQAADRFRAAMGHLAAVSPTAVPRPFPRAKPARKK